MERQPQEAAEPPRQQRTARDPTVPLAPVSFDTFARDARLIGLPWHFVASATSSPGQRQSILRLINAALLRAVAARPRFRPTAAVLSNPRSSSEFPMR